MSYATVSQLRTAIGTDVSDAVDDAYMQQLLDAASSLVDGMTGRSFQAVTATRYYDLPRAGRLWLDADLLSLSVVINGDGTSISLSDIIPAPSIAPYYALDLSRGSVVSWTAAASGETRQVISVTGSWGYSATPPAAIVQATLIIATAYYRARYGADTSGPVTVTPAGIVLTDGSIPRPALALITPYVRYSLAAA